MLRHPARHHRSFDIDQTTLARQRCAARKDVFIMHRPVLRTLASRIGLAIAAAGISIAHGALPPLNAVEVSPLQESPVGRYFVVFDEPGLAYYNGGVAQLEATALRATPDVPRKFDLASVQARAYTAHLAERRALHVSSMESVLQRPLAISHEYVVDRHAISVALTFDEARAMQGVRGVASVRPVGVQQLQTFGGPSLIGAGTLWDGTRVPDGSEGTRGEGIRIGVIDTGAFAAHPSFANDASCGFSSVLPKLVARDCSLSNANGCVGGNPEADAGNGHGVHVASTAAGNTIGNDVVPSPMLWDGGTMSGVAPCAQVASYKACIGTACYDDMLVASAQQAIIDQVDVVNYSIGAGCGYDTPWQASVDFLAATQADVFVAAAAGNTAAECPDPGGRVTNTAPWVTTVAASTSDRNLLPAISVHDAPDVLQDIGLISGSTTLPVEMTDDIAALELRSDPSNPTGCSASGGIAAQHFDGALAVLRRGDCNFSEKIANAAAAGARMVIVANNQPGGISMDTTGAPETIASFSINEQAIGDALLEWIAAPLPQAEAVVFSSGFEVVPAAHARYAKRSFPSVQPDVLASFSLRGPVPSPLSNLAKPDVTAPGVAIYAATDAASGNYQLQSGTSMATPHVAGAAGLLRAIHPTWSVDEIKSALVTTAQADGWREDTLTPWTPDDVGSGRVELRRAARAGLTLQDTEANYLAANPLGGSLDVTQLNLPSLRNVRCGDGCRWTRTFRNRLDRSATWSIDIAQPDGYTLSAEPAQFTLDADASQTVEITATINDVTQPSALSFGRMTLHESTGGASDQFLTVAVKGDEVSVACDDGQCTFRADSFHSGYTAIGCDVFCSFLWASRFSPPLDAFPITLNTVTFLTGSADYVHAGDVFDIYIYQDDDRDPTSGAVLVGSHKGYTIATAGARLRTVTLSTPVVLPGDGDVIIALTNPTGTGPRPAAGEISEFNGRSYVGAYTGEDPDIGSIGVGLQPNPDPVGSEANFVIRAGGTTAVGEALSLGGTTE